MFPTPGNTTIVNDRNFQIKLKKFKKNWLANWNGRTLHQNRIIFKDTPNGNKMQSTKRSSTYSSNKKVRGKTTINPSGDMKKKDPLSRCPVGKYEETFYQYLMITDKLKVNKPDVNLNTTKKTPSQSNSEQTFKDKKKYRRERSKSHKTSKCRNDEDYESSSSSKSSNINISKRNVFKKYPTLNNENPTSKHENTFSKNSRQQSSFRLKSPILFRNSDKSKTTNKIVQSSVTITTDIEFENNEFSSSEGSFSFQKLKWESHSLRSRKIHDHQQISDPWRINDSRTSYNSIHEYRIKNQQNNVLSPLRSLERSENDIRKFSDDSENSPTFSLKCNKRVAVNELVEKNYTHNIEMEMSTSTAFGSKVHNFTDDSLCHKAEHSNFSSNCFGKLRNFSHNLNNKKRLFSGKAPMQWYDMRDSLESSLSTSKEKLNEIKVLFSETMFIN